MDPRAFVIPIPYFCSVYGYTLLLFPVLGYVTASGLEHQLRYSLHKECARKLPDGSGVVEIDPIQCAVLWPLEYSSTLREISDAQHILKN